MIIATVMAILLFFGVGGGPFGELMSKYTEDPIKSTIVDKERREMALEKLKLIKKAINEDNEVVLNDFKQIHELVKNYNSTPEDFDNLLSSLKVKRQQEFDELWKRRSAMLRYIHADEWRTIMRTAKAKMEEEKKK